MATTKFAIQLQESDREDSTGMAGDGTISETKRNGTGPKPIEKDAWKSQFDREGWTGKGTTYNEADDGDC
jgi:hypothetical protein